MVGTRDFFPKVMAKCTVNKCMVSWTMTFSLDNDEKVASSKKRIQVTKTLKPYPI